MKGLSDRQNVEMMRTDWAMGNSVDVPELLDMADRLIENSSDSEKLRQELSNATDMIEDMTTDLDSITEELDTLLEEMRDENRITAAMRHTLTRALRHAKRGRSKGEGR